jgi:hypothetical protein
MTRRRELSGTLSPGLRRRTTSQMAAPMTLVKKAIRDQAYHERPRLAASIATHPARMAEINMRTNPTSSLL